MFKWYRALKYGAISGTVRWRVAKYNNLKNETVKLFSSILHAFLQTTPNRDVLLYNRLIIKYNFSIYCMSCLNDFGYIIRWNYFGCLHTYLRYRVLTACYVILPWDQNYHLLAHCLTYINITQEKHV